ncbi:MAG: metallophosphoesterase [Burkholderiales bacterium]|nr:metallophosphoesterase [Burkholderiales bacterium]MCE1176277.1 metallophosphoesterase [Burkholderiales bacterium]
MMVYAIPLLLGVLLFVLAYYVGRRLIDRHWSDGVKLTLWSILVWMAACAPLWFVFRRFAFLHQNSIIIQGMQYALGLYTIVLFMTVARDVFLILIAVIQAFRSTFKKTSQTFQPYAVYQKQLQRRAFLSQATRVGALVGAAGVFGHAAVRAHGAQPTVVSRELAIDNLPVALDGVQIVQISDLHVGQIHHAVPLIESIVKTVQKLQPDIVVLTGDMTDGMVTQLSAQLAPLAQLKGKYGQFFVTGNHEYYTDKVENWLTHWAQLGFTTLQNQHQVLSINDASLVVAGVHDYRSGKRHPVHVCSPQLALRDAPDVTTILLAHHPDTAYLTDDVRVDVQLSGHTHGGQYFPGTLLVRWVHKFKTGLNRYRNGWVYVNSGTGYWGPALRSTDVVGEISLLTLRRA